MGTFKPKQVKPKSIEKISERTLHVIKQLEQLRDFVEETDRTQVPYKGFERERSEATRLIKQDITESWKLLVEVRDCEGSAELSRSCMKDILQKLTQRLSTLESIVRGIRPAEMGVKQPPSAFGLSPRRLYVMAVRAASRLSTSSASRRNSADSTPTDDDGDDDYNDGDEKYTFYDIRSVNGALDAHECHYNYNSHNNYNKYTLNHSNAGYLPRAGSKTHSERRGSESSDGTQGKGKLPSVYVVDVHSSTMMEWGPAPDGNQRFSRDLHIEDRMFF